MFLILATCLCSTFVLPEVLPETRCERPVLIADVEDGNLAGKEEAVEKRKLGRDALARSLAVKFLEKIILLHGGRATQQFEQRILQYFVFPGFVLVIRGHFKLAQVRGQGAGRNAQFQH